MYGSARPALILLLLLPLFSCGGDSPKTPAELVALARTHRAEGRLDEAQSCLDLAVAREPALVDAYRERARVWEARGHLQFTLDNLDKVTELKQDDADDFRFKAEILERLGRRPEAKHAWDRVIALAAGDATAYFERGRLLAAEDPMAAIGDLDRAVELGLESAAIYRQKAQVLVALGRNEYAKHALDRAIELDPEDAGAHAARGRLLATTDAAHALNDLDRAVAIAPDQAGFQLERARVLVALDRTKAALDALDAAIGRDPALVEAFRLRAELRARSGDAAGAERDRARLAELEGN
ncbi:MAG: tetratricopeptide repeat protein [Planctomycetes bacterium]|nr:tetratricopeptide repeat protein [Planctomycetota bacterium]